MVLESIVNISYELRKQQIILCENFEDQLTKLLF